jgi:hypothetical protein
LYKAAQYRKEVDDQLSSASALAAVTATATGLLN